MHITAHPATERTGKGTGNVPSLVDAKLDSVKPGEVFWFITRGDKDNGMPSWAALPVRQRWQIVTYVNRSGIAKLAGGQLRRAGRHEHVETQGPPPTPPFTDFRYEKPGTTRKITVKDLPQPYATHSADNGPQLVARPDNVWPVAPAGFKVELYASGLDNPRTLRTAPNGDVFRGRERSRTHSGFSRPHQRRQARTVRHFRRRPESPLWAGVSILLDRIRNGYM